YKVSKFDLECFIDGSQSNLVGSVNYATSLYKKDTIDRLVESYKKILSQLVSDKETKIKDYSLLSKEEYQTIVYDWNQTDRDYPKDKTIYQLFEEQVKQNPNNVALVCEGKQLTYKELNERSNQLARYIRKQYKEITDQELKPDTLIPLFLERSIDMVVGILAVMKAGGAYVPMDPDYPQDRFRHILEDTQAKLVITQSHLENKLDYIASDISILIDSDQDESYVYAQEDKGNLSPQSSSTDLAYVIYTSGTTGLPKGAVITHRLLVNRLLWQRDQYSFDSNDRVLQKTPYIFDVSVWELLLPLISSSQLHIAKPEGHKDPEYLYNLIESNEITKLHFVPSMLSAFLSYANTQDISDVSITDVFTSGEALSSSVAREFKELFKEVKLNNLYGPTEVAIDVTSFNDIQLDDNTILIGKPISNIRTYILDRHQQPVPIGVVGELYLGSIDLDRGYLSRPELTAERFISNPFATDEDIAKGYTRLYKTGDLVRWLADGNIEYIGRNDDQVKIRGYRIELGEIENQLSSITGIKQSCVLSKDRNNNKYLVGYYVSDVESLTQEEIFNQLSKVLPEYMVPSVLVEIDSMPLTVNGKLDRKSLPDPEFVNEDSYVAPSNELEERLCNIFAEVLGLERVGITDDFFRIGGDSIVSIRLVGKLRKSGFNISVADVFNYRTVQKLLNNVNHSKDILDKKYIPFSLVTERQRNEVVSRLNILESEIEDIYPASYLQSGMLIESVIDTTGMYHDVFSYRINKKFNKEQFIDIWKKLSLKHDQLRASFIELDEGYYNVIHRIVCIEDKVILKDSSISIEEIVSKEKDIILPLDEAGLYRLIISEREDSFVLIYSFHHAITDGWSVASLISEFVDIYVKEEDIKQELIPSYGKFIRNELAVINNQEYRDFWLNYLENYNYVNNNLILERDSISQEDQIVIDKLIDSNTSAKLLELSKALSISIDNIFLSMYYLVLSKLLNKENLVVGRIANNRLQEENGDKLFGLHLNTIPFRGSINENDTLKDLILGTQDNKHYTERYKLYPYGKLKSDLNIQEDLCQFAFNYIHFHIAEDDYANNSIDSEYSHEKSNIPFFVHVIRYLNNFQIVLKGSNNFIDRSTAERYIKYLRRALNLLVNDINVKIKDYSLLSKEEYQTIVYNWNETDKDYPKDKTIYELFEEQVKQNPNSVALVFEDQELTYKELNYKSNQLARYIRKQYKEITNQELKPDILIPLCLERSLDMVIGILAVMKAGGAYVPMDPEYPEERFRHILKDTQAKLVITQSHLENKLYYIVSDVNLISIDPTEEQRYVYEQEDKEDLPPQSSSTDLAYVIYTSGTTGLPKGVMVGYNSLVIRILHMIKFSNILKDDIYLFKTNYIFDVSISDILTHLLVGAKILITKDAFNESELMYLINNKKPTSIHCVPSQYEILYQYFDNNSSIRKVYFSGESINTNIIESISNNIRGYNYYGPSETGEITSSLINMENPLSIGSVFPNSQAYILDQHQQAVPVGVVGELYIGGAGLARGYLNRPELTAERFVSNPFATEGDIAKGYTRLYKTGDLVRWLEDGNIEYIGRDDDQVKIRGYRIELGEIENQLSAIAGIKQSCVLAKERNNNKYLVGYYVSDVESLTQEEIVNQLSKVLPEYMMPSVLVKIESMPLTVNGKLDRKSLPDPEFVNEDSYVAPTTELEEKLCSIFAEVLGLEKVGITDDFFRIGGDSLLAV
ncbi:non-ribosomal peptide synthetase, partial [Francisella sp. SYW-9]|uniref:non-ribosomal peptide synthetase n=1 Tax=Francisella sp. SYW-9 TaxID=2610888 RepID=UPI00123CA659